MPISGAVERMVDSVRLWRGAAAVLGTAAAALMVAALVARDAPDFAERPVIAVLRGAADRPAWSVRLARAAHQVAVDGLDPPAAPAGKAYQLWLVAPGGASPQPLGLLPFSGRKILAETPANIRRLAGKGQLWVTLEPATGTLAEAPSGAPAFHAELGGPR
jgi:anti-sigma-K factor RskA